MAETLADGLSFDDAGESSDSLIMNVDVFRQPDKHFHEELGRDSVVAIEEDETLGLTARSIPSWDISEDGTLATWAISMSEAQVQSKRMEYADEAGLEELPSVEFVLEKTAESLCETLQGDSALHEQLGCESSGLMWWAEVATDGARVTVNLVFEATTD